VLSAKEALPCAVVEHDRAAGALLIVFGPEGAAEGRLGAEGAEPGPGDLRGEQVQRVSVLLRVEALLVGQGGGGDQRGERSGIGLVGRGDADAGQIELRVARVKRDQAGRGLRRLRDAAGRLE
jgi:hypothetical protein